MNNLHTAVWFQIIVHREKLSSSIWFIDGTLTFTTTVLGQSEPESNGDEVVLHIPQNPWLEPYHQM